MPKMIIAGVDGRDGGQDALAFARRLAGPGAGVLVAHAYPYEHHALTRALAGGHAEMLQEDAARLLAEATEGLDADPAIATRALPDRSPARALHELAEREHADLLVVGSSHHGPAGRLLLGSVARSVLHGSPCPVAIVPRGFRLGDTGITAIGVAYDGTPQADAALAHAERLAGEQRASLHVRTVVVTSASPLGAASVIDPSPFIEQQHRLARERLDARIAGLQAPATGDVVEGPTAYELERLADEVDLLVAGSRGWGAVLRVVLGSTTDRLAHTLRCPLIVVPAPAEDAGSRR